MAESTATLTYWDFLDAVSRLAGWGTAHTDEDNLALAREIVERSNGRFLYPEIIASKFAHSWSFLSPIAELTWRTQKETGTANVSTTTVTCAAAHFQSYGVREGDTLVVESGGAADAGEYTIDSVDSETQITLTSSAGSGESTFYIDEPAWQYPLPDDFGHMVREFTYLPGASLQSMTMGDEGKIERSYVGGITTGTPQLFAIRPKTLQRETGQRFELVVWPAPASAKTVKYRYAVEPGLLGYVRSTGSGTVDTDVKTLTDDGAAFDDDGCIAGDKVILSDVATGQTAGIYTIAADGVAATELTLTSEPGADGTCTYEVLPAKLYHYGGRRLSETLREICLGTTEEELDDAPGVHAARAQLMLAAAIDRDFNNAARFLGMMEDPSTRKVAGRLPRQEGLVEYNTS